MLLVWSLGWGEVKFSNLFENNNEMCMLRKDSSLNFDAFREITLKAFEVSVSNREADRDG